MKYAAMFFLRQRRHIRNVDGANCELMLLLQVVAFNYQLAASSGEPRKRSWKQMASLKYPTFRLSRDCSRFSSHSISVGPWDALSYCRNLIARFQMLTLRSCEVGEGAFTPSKRSRLGLRRPMKPLGRESALMQVATLKTWPRHSRALLLFVDIVFLCMCGLATATVQPIPATLPETLSYLRPGVVRIHGICLGQQVEPLLERFVACSRCC